ncbi:LBP / BPI / CETP family protein [Teladorsagia circumcincta]|uniref:LBP / BPI / CETP family protein n=1 Tax=Teladorsagia circumcincta TaxID=45464 RepID=A0A2G9URG9_TELCI|nr:LBP / BPI / CETP family protein [Teladorsagia circumcincta]
MPPSNDGRISAWMIANNLLAEQLPRINIPDVEHRLPGDQGAIFISRIKISRFRRAEIQDVSTSAPNRIMWIMKNLDLGFIGDLSGAVNIVVPFNLTGQAEVQAEGLSVQLDSAIERAPNGSAHISTISCHSTIRAVEVINHNGGLFGLAVTVFKQGVSDNVRLMLQGIICKKVRKYLDEDLNEKLAEVQTRSPLSEAIETNAIRATKLTSAVGGATLGNLLGKAKHFQGVLHRLQDRNVSGSVELTKFELSSRSGTVRISNDELSDISILVSQLIENMLNEMLSTGFPLPLPHVLRLQNVAVEVLTRRILIRTDIAVDERRLSRLAEQTLFNGPQFNGHESPLRTFIRMASR